MRKYTEIYAYLSTDPKGDEHLCAFKDPLSGSWMPMTSSEQTVILQMHSIADEMVKASGVTIRLVRYSAREDLEVIRPPSH